MGSEGASEGALGFSQKVANKVVGPDALRSSIGARPREQSVVMCHGTFDLVHPGHLRHLAYAKSRGSLLVVSVTADRFITKANARPYVPQELRALNLAALELVDFVLIDDHPEPLHLIAQIEPDIFMKGFEYENLSREKTSREKRAVEAYGGEILFSPGDFTLSSSALIENDPPDLSLEKLLTLMHVEGVTFPSLYKALDALDGTQVTVVGDLIVDAITTASLIGGFRKTPTPSLRVDTTEKFIGGAGIVAKHMAAAGASATLVSIVGDDEDGEFARDDLASSGVRSRMKSVRGRPTTLKNAVFASGHPVVRLDVVSNEPIDAALTEELAGEVRALTANAVVYSDFRHGVFHKDSTSMLLSAAPDGTFTVADSQVASRWGNILDFAGCHMLTPNEQEVRFALGDQDTVVRPLGSALYERADCRLLILKMGARGAITYRASRSVDERRAFFTVDSLSRRSVVDPVGAGDALLAYATLVQVTSGNEVLASIIGAVAAGLACEREGNVPIDKTLVAQRIEEIESELRITGASPNTVGAENL